MNGSVLEAEELHALLSAVAPKESTRALLATLPPLQQPENVEPHEFGEKPSTGPEEYPMFGSLHERLTEILLERWSAIFHRETPVFFKEITGNSYIELLDNDDPCIYFTLESEGHGTMLMVLDMALVVSYIDALLGGSGEIAPEEDATLTPVELRLAERIAQSTCDMLSKLWEPVREMTFTLHRIDMDSMNLALIADDVQCFSVTNVIVLGEKVRGDISLHYPLPFLEPMLMDMRRQAREQATDPDDGWGKELRTAIDQTPMELRLELGRCLLPIRDFLRLSPGDFLPMTLPEQEPSKIWIEQFPMFLASPGRQQGVLAAEILTTIKSGGNT